jgi:hypothetical protein
VKEASLSQPSKRRAWMVKAESINSGKRKVNHKIKVCFFSFQIRLKGFFFIWRDLQTRKSKF